MNENKAGPAIPKQIVVYSYYGDAVYFDGRLVRYFGVDSRFYTEGWDQLCRLFGISFEKRSVKWEDWPGQKTNSKAVYTPPDDLKVVEDYFSRLEVERRKDRIEQLKGELTRLESEEATRVEGQ